MSASVTRLDDRRDGPRILGALQLVRRYSKARGSARAVLIVIASYADADGTNTWPGTALIAEEAGVDVSTVKRARRKLLALGEIEVVRVGYGSTSTRYRVTLQPPEGETVPERIEGSKRPGVRLARGQIDTPGGVQGDTPGGVHSDPLPSITDQNREGGDADTCRAHQGLEDPPACRRCQKIREANETARREYLAAAAAAKRVAEQEAARLASLELEARRPPAEVRAAKLEEIRAEKARHDRTRSGTVTKTEPKG